MNYISRVMDIDFRKIVTDFKEDILRTFPEYSDILRSAEDEDEDGLNKLKDYCKTVYPERFFDILYQNDKIFLDNSLNTCFLPGLDFKEIWKEDITETTKETIWKYLQLILLNIVGTLDQKSSFGDTTKLFEAIQQDELQSKLKETMEQMQTMFDMSGSSIPDCSMEHLPNSEDIHDHISGILDGKLGRLAKEIAEETAEELDITDTNKVDDIFKKLFTNPKQLMDLVKSVGTKLDNKLKSGDLNEAELMAEASELVGKMKNMPGMDNFKDMFSKMGNAGAFQQKMKQQMNMMQMRERMKKKKQTKEGAGEGAGGAGEGVTMEEISEENLAAAQEYADKMMRELLDLDSVKKPKKKRRRKKKKYKKEKV